MGNRLFSQTSSSQDSVSPVSKPAEPQEHWRELNGGKDEILHEVMQFKPSTDTLRIVLFGPNGAGKSAFVNSVQRILLGRNAMSALENSTHTGTTFTKKLKIHKLKKSRGEHYPLEIVDIMGIESEEGGIKPEDIIKAFQGHILDDYTFNPVESIPDNNPKYKKDPAFCDQVHCLVCVLPANSVSMMHKTVFEKMKKVRESASNLGIPQVIVMTKVDETCQLVKKDLNNTYSSKKIHEKVKVCSANVGIPLNAVYPVKNYSNTITQDEVIDLLILTALRDILNFANDYVERELEKDEK